MAELGEHAQHQRSLVRAVGDVVEDRRELLHREVEMAADPPEHDEVADQPQPQRQDPRRPGEGNRGEAVLVLRGGAVEVLGQTLADRGVSAGRHLEEVRGVGDRDRPCLVRGRKLPRRVLRDRSEHAIPAPRAVRGADDQRVGHEASEIGDDRSVIPAR